MAFRNGNVVGRRQTHGVGFDFVRRLREDPTRLSVLGTGASRSPTSWPATWSARSSLCSTRARATRSSSLNVATGDYVTVREIVGLALEVSGLDADDVNSVRRAATGVEGRRARRPTEHGAHQIAWLESEHWLRRGVATSMRAMLDDLAAGRK